MAHLQTIRFLMYQLGSSQIYNGHSKKSLGSTKSHGMTTHKDRFVVEKSQAFEGRSVLNRGRAKVLANRLKKVMDSIISPCQMAFVKGRKIVDSFVIAGDDEWARVFRCASADLPITYLGLPLGDAARKAWKVRLITLFVPFFGKEFVPQKLIFFMATSKRSCAVFNGKDFDVMLALDSKKYKVVWWFKNFGRCSNEDITILLLDIAGRCVDRKPVKIPKIGSWFPLGGNDLFFNMDGSVKVSSRSAGIGGVLRDTYGKILCFFSYYIGFEAPIETELSAIYKACILIASCQNLNNRHITIMSDSSTVVSWINEEGFGLLSHVNLLYDIRQVLNTRRSLEAKFTVRDANSLVDCLAKAGVDLSADRLEWSVS
ncbi:hypothetical protein Ddye_015926 [Dipteronia dyeriana]|uniref:RNase H type-1 domain-containing protein n=1 Tax=Dipteronia dyeriana TaxID=168575 RepID=A0AAD9WZR9_9ROSI|nr:hypothetical protein Ddye_015926 [Dipteronia dyeriana]